ncbi:hypothetical protein TEU_03290 [Thermococcus eurythermalis]|uniref:Uncharacterized protein n=2 Tax=Thermococcus eurythermalis TaxID=1505907 RepID=A0A097QSI7_9EURY|nr:hypothetical protein TEU_03290 [Thermococcus eurythermalis]
MVKKTEKKTKRRATHTVFLDDKAFEKYKKLKELVKVTTNKRADTSAVVDALITIIAEKNLIDDFIELYHQKLLERKKIAKEEKVNLEEFIEALRE